MYTTHFRLAAEPFALTPDPEFLYLSRAHAEALAALRVSIAGRRGLIVMTGEVGTGKTTLLYALLRAVGDEMATAYVANTTLGFEGVLRLALDDFGVRCASTDRVKMLSALNRFLRQCADGGRPAVLIVDEAQNLDDEAFEQLRQLTNFETFTHKLLQIVLVGQPELDARLQLPQLRALTERVAVHCRLTPLGMREGREYIAHRLQRAGGAAWVFDDDAREPLLHAAEGLPRRINILCDTALLFAYGRGADRVTLEIARAAVAGWIGRAASDPDATWSSRARAVVDHTRTFAERAAVSARALAERARERVPARASEWLPTQPVAPQVGLAIGAAAVLLAIGAVGIRTGQALGARQHSAAHVSGASTNGPSDAILRDAGAQAAMPPRHGGPAVRPAGDGPILAADASRQGIAPLPPPPAASAPAPSLPACAPVPESGSAPRPSDGPLASVRPAPAQGPAAAAREVSETGGVRTMRVVRGTTLGELAREVYGEVDPSVIRHIQRANPQVRNPNLILVGDVLRFPELHAAAGER